MDWYIDTSDIQMMATSSSQFFSCSEASLLFVFCTYTMYITSTHILTCCFSCLLVMAELRRLDSLSVEEAIAVWKDWRWEANLLSVAATKDSKTVKSIASVMDTHGYSEECEVLKGM